MTRAYLRLSPSFFEDKETYPDGALTALVGVLCLAESQPRRGRFKSEKLLRVLLGRRGRWIAFLFDHGDLCWLNGAIYVVGWDEWQEGDTTVSERMARVRHRKEIAAVIKTVSPTVTNGTAPGVNTTYSGGGGDGTLAEAAGRITATPDRMDSETLRRLAADPSTPAAVARAALKALEVTG